MRIHNKIINVKKQNKQNKKKRKKKKNIKIKKYHLLPNQKKAQKNKKKN